MVKMTIFIFKGSIMDAMEVLYWRKVAENCEVSTLRPIKFEFLTILKLNDIQDKIFLAAGNELDTSVSKYNPFNVTVTHNL